MTQTLPSADLFEHHVSARGVEVHLFRTRKFKAVQLVWMAEAPLDAGRTARSLLPDLLTRGTASCPEISDLAGRCEELYNTDLLSAVTACGPTQVLRLGFETVADRFAGGRPLFSEAVDLLAEVLHAPPLVDGRFRADHFEQERDNLVHAIRGLADDKHVFAYRRMVETMHAGTPWALHSWGTVDDALALDESAVHAAWDALREQLPVRMFVVGDVEREVALAAADRLAGAGPRRPTPGRVAAPELPVREVHRVTEREPLNQSKLVLGFRMRVAALPGAEAPLFALAFGGGSHSRLFKRVREQESLAYGCGASLVLDASTLVVQAGIDPAKAARVEELVLDELRRLADDGLDDDEFELSRKAQLRRLRNLRDAPRELVQFTHYGLMTGRATVLDDAIARVQAAKKEDVSALAADATLDTVYLLEGDAP